MRVTSTSFLTIFLFTSTFALPQTPSDLSLDQKRAVSEGSPPSYPIHNPGKRQEQSSVSASDLPSAASSITSLGTAAINSAISQYSSAEAQVTSGLASIGGDTTSAVSSLGGDVTSLLGIPAATGTQGPVESGVPGVASSSSGAFMRVSGFGGDSGEGWQGLMIGGVGFLIGLSAVFM